MWSRFIAGVAKADISDIYIYGYQLFGEQVAEDYNSLISQALEDIGTNPYRLGAKPVLGKNDGLYQYPLSLSKRRTASKIKKPRHIVLYYIFEREQALVIARVLREGREQAQSNINRAEIMEDLS